MTGQDRLDWTTWAGRGRNAWVCLIPVFVSAAQPPLPLCSLSPSLHRHWVVWCGWLGGWWQGGSVRVKERVSHSSLHASQTIPTQPLAMHNTVCTHLCNQLRASCTVVPSCTILHHHISAFSPCAGCAGQAGRVGKWMYGMLHLDLDLSHHGIVLRVESGKSLPLLA